MFNGRMSAWIVGLGLFCGGGQALAVNYTWSSPTGGDFLDADNWTPAGGPPVAGDLAIFLNNLDDTITFSGDATHQDAQLRNTSGTITFDVGEHQWTNRFVIVGATPDTTSRLILASGSAESERLMIGNHQNSTNNYVEVTGEGTLWRVTDTTGVRLGSANGGSDNTLVISDGAVVQNVTTFAVGLGSTRNNTLTVTGPGSQLRIGNLFYIGGSVDSTNNQVRIEDGAFVDANNAFFGFNAAGPDNSVTVTGAGSTLEIFGSFGLRVGHLSSGNEMSILDGAQVVLTGASGAGVGSRVSIGEDANSTNNLLVVDGGHLSMVHATDDLEVPRELDVRRGELRLESGLIETGRLTANTGSTAVINLNGGTLAAGSAEVNNGLPLQVGNGGQVPATYRMLDAEGTHSFADGLVLAGNGRLEGSGRIAGNVSASAAGASVAVGQSIGLIEVEGDWNSLNMDILLDIGDLTGAVEAGVSHDLLDISGTFTHGGSVQVDLSNLQASSAMELQLIGWGASAGDAGDTAVSFLGGSATFDIRPDGLYVDVVPTITLLPGDANRDGRVDGEDFLIWQAAFGTQEGATWDDGDFNGDGRVDGEDFLIWQAHFGSVAESSTVTPEPASMALIVGGLLLCARRSRSR